MEKELKSVVERLQNLKGKEVFFINTEVLYFDTDRVLVKATISSEGVMADGTAMVERIEGNQFKDYSYVQTAETIAVGRALGFMFPDEQICSEEEAQRNNDMVTFDDRKSRSEAATETLINKLEKNGKAKKD